MEGEVRVAHGKGGVGTKDQGGLGKWKLVMYAGVRDSYFVCVDVKIISKTIRYRVEDLPICLPYKRRCYRLSFLSVPTLF